MTRDDIIWANATELSANLRNGQLSVVDVADAVIERVEETNTKINAYVTFDPQAVRGRAAALDAKRAAGETLGPLFGVPYSIKMLTMVEGQPSHGGLLPHKDNVAAKDAVVARRLAEADGLFTGMTNAPETGYYGGTDNHIYGPTHNPWKHGYSAGGSSGGAAASVAAGMCSIAEGADGAGSVRIPASMCGVVGLKPSLGRIPQTLLEGRFYTNIFHGPIARTVEDCALMLDSMVGESPADPLSLPAPDLSFSSHVDRSISGWRIAYSEDLGTGAILEPEVAAVCRDALSVFESLGASVTEKTPAWPSPEEAMWHGVWVPCYGGERDLLDWDAVRDDVDPQLYELIKTGETLTMQQYSDADIMRGRMYDTYLSFMENFELIVSPTLASATFPLSDFAPSHLAGESLRRQLLGWLLTYPFNMLTVPAITVPAGMTSDGRPVGLQIAGRFRADGDVIAAASRFQEAHPVETQARCH